MKYLNYSEALQICRDKTDELTKKRILRKWCEEQSLDYHKVQVYIRGKHLKRYPKLIAKFLIACGYEGVTVERKVVYNFTVDNL